jgi:hypothetical protein
MEKEGNTTTVCCIYAITDGVANEDVVALFFGRWCKDKHVKVN